MVSLSSQAKEVPVCHTSPYWPLPALVLRPKIKGKTKTRTETVIIKIETKTKTTTINTVKTLSRDEQCTETPIPDIHNSYL